MALRNVFQRKRYTEIRRDRELDRPMSYRSDKEKSRLYYGRNYDEDEDLDFDDRDANTRRQYEPPRLRNRYGGDTSNYGNANQGGFDRQWWENTRDKVRSWLGVEKDEYMPVTADHAGHGPKNYCRTEQRIYEDVCDRLLNDEFVDASDMEVKVQDDVVILEGTVSTRTEKRRADDIAASVRCVRDVENRLRILPRG